MTSGRAAEQIRAEDTRKDGGQKAGSRTPTKKRRPAVHREDGGRVFLKDRSGNAAYIYTGRARRLVSLKVSAEEGSGRTR